MFIYLILWVINLVNLWEEDILKLIVLRAGNDRRMVQFLCHFLCI